MRHAGSAIYIHVAWATWDRLPLLSGDFEREVYRSIAAKCAEMGSEVIAIGGVEDHIHLLINLPPAVALATLIGQAKGAASHLATHKLLPDGTFFKWQGAYGAVSVSPRALPAAAAYIRNQKAHHAAQSLIPEWEPLSSRAPNPPSTS